MGNKTNKLNTPLHCNTSTNCDGNIIIKWTPEDSSGIFGAEVLGQSGSTLSLFNFSLDVRIDQYDNIYVADSRNYTTTWKWKYNNTISSTKEVYNLILK